LKAAEILTTEGLIKDPYMQQIVPKGYNASEYRFYPDKCLRDRVKEVSP
jgi:hypothetical protein